jgi:hypothetical protein
LSTNHPVGIIANPPRGVPAQVLHRWRARYPTQEARHVNDKLQHPSGLFRLHHRRRHIPQQAVPLQRWLTPGPTSERSSLPLHRSQRRARFRL